MIYHKEIESFKKRIIDDFGTLTKYTSEDFSNVYGCVGNRGQGKSTFLNNLRETLSVEKDFVVLDMIDPNLLEEKSGIFELLIFRLREYVCNNKPGKNDRDNDRKRRNIEKVDVFWDKYKSVIFLDKTDSNEYYKDYEYRNVQVENKKKEELSDDLVELIKDVVGPGKMLVLMIDDLDMTEITKIHDALFFMHKFLRCENMKIVLSFSQFQMIEAIKSKLAFDREFLIKASGEDHYQHSVNSLSYRIYEKIIPTTNRVNLEFDAFDAGFMIEDFFNKDIIDTTYYSVKEDLMQAIENFVASEELMGNLGKVSGKVTDENFAKISVKKNAVSLNVCNFIEYIVFVKTGLSFVTDQKRKDNTWISLLSSSLRGINHFIIKVLQMDSIGAALSWNGTKEQYSQKKRNIELLNYEFHSSLLLKDMNRDLRRIYTNTYESPDAMKKLVFFNDMVDYINLNLEKDEVKMQKLSTTQIDIITIADIYNIIIEASKFYYNKAGGKEFKITMNYLFTSLLTRQLCDLKIDFINGPITLNKLYFSDYYNTINKNVIPVNISLNPSKKDNKLVLIKPSDIISNKFSKYNYLQREASKDYRIFADQFYDEEFVSSSNVHENLIAVINRVVKGEDLLKNWDDFNINEELRLEAERKYAEALILTKEMIISNRNFYGESVSKYPNVDNRERVKTNNILKKSFINTEFAKDINIQSLDTRIVSMRQAKYADYSNCFVLNATVENCYCFSNLFDIDVLCSEKTRNSSVYINTILKKFSGNLEKKYGIYILKKDNDEKGSVIKLENKFGDAFYTLKVGSEKDDYIYKDIFDNVDDKHRSLMDYDKILLNLNEDLDEMTSSQHENYSHLLNLKEVVNKIENRNLPSYIILTSTKSLNNYRTLYNTIFKLSEKLDKLPDAMNSDEVGNIITHLKIIEKNSKTSTLFLNSNMKDVIEASYDQVIARNMSKITKVSRDNAVSKLNIIVDIIVSLYAIQYVRTYLEEMKNECHILTKEISGEENE